MTLQSIRYFSLVSLLVVQTVQAQIPVTVSSSPALQEQGRPQDKRTDRSSSNGDGSIPEKASTSDPLLNLLINKRLLTLEEARTIAAADPETQRDRLATLLKEKGLISAAEFDSLRATAANNPNVASTPASSEPPSSAVNAVPNPPAQPQKPAAPSVIAAVAPVRLLPIDVPQREGLAPDIKLGSGTRIKPYGYFKTSVIRDSSSPGGNDFPLPLLAADTGPNSSPEFHLKARALRLGANFEWIDPAPKTVITGRIEFDFEGDFTRVDNRNISSIRSSQPSLRLAWARIDRRFNDKTSAFLLFGQDWTPFASSTLPNTIENTNFGGIGYGASYERLPQVRGGFNYNIGGGRSWKIQPEFAVVFPAFGNLPTNVADQLGFGERQGADSDQPGLQSRVVLQWQLDKADGVAPAEFIASYEHARRSAIVTAASVPAQFSAAFPSGVEVSSDSNRL